MVFFHKSYLFSAPVYPVSHKSKPSAHGITNERGPQSWSAEAGKASPMPGVTIGSIRKSGIGLETPDRWDHLLPFQRNHNAAGEFQAFLAVMEKMNLLCGSAPPGLPVCFLNGKKAAHQ